MMHTERRLRRSGRTAPARAGAVLVVLSVLLLPALALAQGPEYDLSWWTVDGGGTTWISGGEYAVGATIGQPDAAVLLSGGEYGLLPGFWDGWGGPYLAYLPMVARNDLRGPDLVVVSILATADDVQIVIRNQGNAAVLAVEEFWLDFYVDPNPPPTAVNQTWPQLSSQGLVWGVTAPALPLLPGAQFTLRVGDGYFWPDLSYVEWPLLEGAPVYVQVDSANVWTDYGAVRESHESVGGPYNNILGPVVVQPGLGVEPPSAGGRPPDAGGNLPPRPW